MLFAPCPVSPWLCPAACSGQEWLQEGQRGLMKAALVAQLGEAPPALAWRDRRGSGVQCEMVLPGGRSRLERAVLGPLCREGEGQDRTRPLCCSRMSRTRASTRPLFQRGQVSWVVARESKLSIFTLCGPSHLADSSAERLTNTLLRLWETFFFQHLQHR